MSISISFGSFGDIVSLVQLAASVISRLASSAGNSERYSELLLELHTLSGALASLQNELHTPRAPSRMPTELRRDIEARIAACRASLEKMERSIVWQQQRLRGRYPKHWRDLWLRAGWRLFAEEELQRYREDARRHRDSVHFALSMLNRESVEDTHRIAVTARSTLDNVSAMAESTRCEVKLVLKNVLEMRKPSPVFLGFPWEGARSYSERPICFVNGYRQKFQVPIDFFMDFRMLDNLVNYAMNCALKVYPSLTPRGAKIRVAMREWTLIDSSKTAADRRILRAGTTGSWVDRAGYKFRNKTNLVRDISEEVLDRVRKYGTLSFMLYEECKDPRFRLDDPLNSWQSGDHIMGKWKACESIDADA